MGAVKNVLSRYHTIQAEEFQLVDSEGNAIMDPEAKFGGTAYRCCDKNHIQANPYFGDTSHPRDSASDPVSHTCMDKERRDKYRAIVNLLVQDGGARGLAYQELLREARKVYSDIKNKSGKDANDMTKKLEDMALIIVNKIDDLETAQDKNAALVHILTHIRSQYG